jgi:D-alanyl-D-alanine carboxypeptidase/D-alanyl-D-alanine-endopeptidase (penicillin-binding protein 4)
MASVTSPRRVAALALAAAAALAVSAAAQARTGESTPLQQRLAKALVVPHVNPTRSAAVAFELGTGEVVYAQNGTRPLAPASTEKIPVAYVALSALGPEFRIETIVLGEGEREDAFWRGDVVLQGHGDPTLSSADLAALARQVRNAGIRRVVGSIVGDESWFDSRRTAPGWKSWFYVNESPPLSALSVDRGRRGGLVAPDPPLAAAQSFRAALVKAGVAVTGTATTGKADDYAFPLAKTVSPPLASIVRFMDRESDNFTAELLLKELGALLAGQGTTAAGALAVTRELAAAGVPLAGVRIVDGSGLSRLDRLTANALVAIFGAAWADPEVYHPLLASLPVAGVNGTLEDRMRGAPARGNVFAKTGTTDVASALSGFVRGRYAFAVLQNGSPLPYWWARRAQDRFATVLAAQ